MLIKQLFTTSYQVRLDDHRPFGNFTATIAQAGVQKAVLGDTYLFLRQHIKDGRNRTEIIILLLVDQMHMYNLCHILYCINIDANILNNNYMEYFSLFHTQETSYSDKIKEAVLKPLIISSEAVSTHAGKAPVCASFPPLSPKS